MTSRAVSRTCEHIDEATLLYAVIKVVTGNSLIKANCNFMIKYSKLIKVAEDKLECVKYDIEARDKEPLKGDS